MRPICKVDQCGALITALGYCQKHYIRFRKYGSPLKVRCIKPANGEPMRWVLDALASNTEECLIWPYSTAKGYGQIWVGGRRHNLHRYVCTQAHGEAPTENLAAAHACGVALCGNPRHLRWKTYAENEADKIAHGTATFGENRPASKLLETQVRAIREASGTHEAIAAVYGVSRRTIGAIKTGQNWGWLP